MSSSIGEGLESWRREAGLSRRMADSGSAGDRGGGGGVPGDGASLADSVARKPPRPSLMLPPRSSLESLFHHGGGGGGGSEVSPGPLTLVSSFFAEDPESDCRSFTQLLVGEITSPAGGARGAPEAEGEQKDAVNSSSEHGGVEQRRVDGDCAGSSGLVRTGENRPAGLEVSRPEAFMFPPGESPASLMISPGFFASALRTFAVSHQEALAQVTAQASQSQFTMPSQAENSCVLVTTSLTQQPVQTLQPKNNTIEPKEGSHSDHRSHHPSVVVDKPAADGYNWRKYGQKIVKGSEYPRSYYKCSHLNCPVKKKIEHSVDGQISEIIYKGQHNHQRPKSNKRSKEGSTFATSSNESTGNVDNQSKLESDFHGHYGNLITSNGKSTETRSEQLSDYGTSEQLSGTSDREEAPEMLTDEMEDHDADAKRMKVVASSQASSTEPRIVVQTTSEVDLLDDGYRWRKYGQKVVKGNPNPRSYYKCTFHGCNVRKHIERAAADPKAVITTYEGKHNHDVPSSRNSHHNMMVASAASSILQSHSQASRSTRGLRNNDQQSLAVLQLKKEHEIT